MEIASPRPVAISDENTSQQQKVMELNTALQTLRDQLAVVKDICQDLKEGELLILTVKVIELMNYLTSWLN